MSAVEVAAYRVLVHDKTGTGEHLVCEGGELVIGRDPDCGVSLANGQVSRRHAALRVLSGALEIEDLGSRNGTVVDAVPIAACAPQRIGVASVVRIGDAVLVFELARAEGAAQWCFDRATFERRAAALLAEERSAGAHAGILEIYWEVPAGARGTTLAEPKGPPARLQQVLPRIAGPRGLIAPTQGRLTLILPDTDAARLAASAALVERLFAEHGHGVVVRSASSPEATSLEGLVARCAGTAAQALVPPVIFQGGRQPFDALSAKLDGSDAPVLIVGETGVGKDVLARKLHARSRRARGPFVALNCAALTEALFESELFGHERGAFTGATHAKPGLIESASGGTVFLDEVGEMPLGLQAKLLRVVENREVLRVGALAPRAIDVRFVFATNRDLRREIDERTFRADLFFRIATITLAIPPLRERVEEIVPLACHFAEAAAIRLRQPPPALLPETARLLEAHAWPGNVRELKNAIELAVLIHDHGVVRPADVHIDRFVARTDRPAHAFRAPEAGPAQVSSAPAASNPSAPASAVSSSERDRIVEALERAAGNQSEAARMLGMPRRTLVKRLGQYGLPRPRKRL